MITMKDARMMVGFLLPTVRTSQFCPRIRSDMEKKMDVCVREGGKEVRQLEEVSEDRVEDRQGVGPAREGGPEGAPSTDELDERLSWLLDEKLGELLEAENGGAERRRLIESILQRTGLVRSLDDVEDGDKGAVVHFSATRLDILRRIDEALDAKECFKDTLGHDPVLIPLRLPGGPPIYLVEPGEDGAVSVYSIGGGHFCVECGDFVLPPYFEWPVVRTCKACGNSELCIEDRAVAGESRVR